MNKKEIVLKKFSDGFNCAQSIFSTYCDEFGLESEKALKISTSFGGGMGHTGETCGAVTGALMVIGLKYGRTDVNDTAAKERNSAMVQKFASEFRQIHGSLRCTDLLGLDLGTEEGFNKAKESGLTRQVCPKFLSDSVDILERIIG
jgi:C_GCAxxG_C_C family probable redox protein